MAKTLCVFLCVYVTYQTVFCQAGTVGEVNGLSKLDITQATDNQTNLKDDIKTARAEANNPELLSSSSIPVANYVTEIETENNDYVPEFLDPLECGFRNMTYRRRHHNNFVVGGRRALLGQYPWMALLGYNTRRGRQWGCGGSLISVRHVLTAAHCIYNNEHILDVVRLGELDYVRDDDGAHPVDYLIKTMIPHEEYDPNTSSNDIGILVLEKDVTFTNLINPICMPKGKWRNATFEGSVEYIAGWGFTSFRGTPASHLQSVYLPVHNNSVCADAFKDYKGRTVDQRVMCAGFKDGSKDSCNGDSGGPLMNTLDWHGEEAYMIVTGVVSYGLQCGYFGVYTRVTYFLPWIEEKVLGRVMS